MRFKDRVFIVTGSTTGIGKAIASRCCAEGASVLIHGLEEDLGRQIAASLGPKAHFQGGDLADIRTPAILVQAAVDRFGGLDGLVNNGAHIVRSDIHTTDVALFDRMIAVNLRAPLLLIQAALPHLEARKGCVINIGSLNGYCGEGNLLAYSLSKGALMTLSRNLGDWLHRDHGVRVNHLNVGWTLTANEYKYKVADGYPKNWPDCLPKGATPTGRILKPEEVAGMVVHWLSDEVRPISGSVVDLEQYPLMGHIPLAEDR